jgi:glycosyltransferase involved in cell wall biosynthesis
MEAMAAGCLVVSSKLGALPETTAGFGFLMEASSDVIVMAREFAKVVVALIHKAHDQPEQFEEGIRRQRSHVRAVYNWTTRVQEWEQALQRLPRRP